MRSLRVLSWTALLLPMLLAAGFAGWSLVDTLARARATALQTATMLREHALRSFEAQQTAIDRVDARIAGMSWEEIEASGDVHLLLRRIADASPHIDGLWLTSPEGRTVNSADFFPMPQSIVDEREYFRVLRERDVLHLGEMIEGRIKGNLNFNISRRRSVPGGGFDGLILVTSSLSYFDAFWRDAVGEGSHIVSILRDDGEILARYPAVTSLPEAIDPRSPFFREIEDRAAGTYANVSRVDGATRIYGFAKLGEFPAYMMVGIDRAPLVAAWAARAALGLAFALAAALALAALVRIVDRHQRSLSDEIRRRRLAETTLMAKQEHVAVLERARAALHESESRFRSLFETLTQGVVFHDADGRIVQSNAAAQRILGLPEEVLAGLAPADGDWQAVDGDGRPLAPEDHPAMVALRTGAVVRGRLMGVRNGEEDEQRWIVVDAVPQFRPASPRPSGAFVLFSDVTSRRRSEEAQTLLLREVDHRAKNALAVVLALIRLTRADDVPGFVRTLEGRIGALARAHTLLSHNRWEGAELRRLVLEELGPFAASPDMVAADGPSLWVSAGAAQPLSMVMHELATNAAKHGALSRPGGRIAVSWSIDPAADELLVRWSESGGPPAAVPARRGFGSQLVRSTVESQLDGRIEHDWAAEGLEVCLFLPATSTVQRRRSRGGAIAEPARPAAPDPAPAAGAVRRVLLVEDNAVVAMELAATLADLGCDVLGPATTLEEGLKLAAEERADAAILDMDLRGRPATPIAEALRARGVPFVFCTGFGDVGERDGRFAGVPVVRKPAASADIAAALDRLGEAARAVA
jgi:PAS domain S-box-containing protein